MKLPFYWVDAFAAKVFSGNPAGVVPLGAWLDEALMQRIAFEHGISETAFFVPTGPGRYHLRWFTPGAEVDLCGHVGSPPGSDARSEASSAARITRRA